MKFPKLKTAKVLKENQMDKFFGGAMVECTVSCSSGCKPSCKPGEKNVEVLEL